MPRVYSNNASTTLINPLNTSDTIFIVSNTGDAVAQFPDLTDPADFAIITVENADGSFEIMKLTNVDSGTNQFTVVRGDTLAVDDIDKTTSIAFLAGARVELRTTAGAFSSYLQRDGETIHGGVFGATPAAPAESQTIVVKHSTGTVAPILSDVEIGELAFNAKTRKLYVGGVDALNAKELVELLAGIYVGIGTPDYPSEGMLWWNPTDNALRVYGNDAAWHFCIGESPVTEALKLLNNIALQGRNAADSAWQDLIKINASDEVIAGDTDLTLFSIITAATRVKELLQLRTASDATKGWELFVAMYLGAPFAQLRASAANGALAIVSKNGAGTDLPFTFGNDGYIKLPHFFLPTDNLHVASKYYVDTKVAAVPAITHAVSVNAAGAIFGTALAVASITKGAAGRYTINLSTALTSVNNAVITVTPRNNATTGTVVAVAAYPTSVSTIDVFTRINGTLSNSDFSLMVLDTGA